MASDQVQGVFFNGETGVRFMSNTTGYVVDLLCEGEIEEIEEVYIDDVRIQRLQGNPKIDDGS